MKWLYSIFSLRRVRVLTAIYVILGGYTATALNDFIQGIIMLAGIVLVIVIAIGKAGGLSTALTELGNISDTGVPQGSLNSLFGPDPQSLFGVVILTSLGTWGLPQMVHKFYAIKDEAAIKKGTIISTIFAIVVSCGSYFLGGFDRLFCTTDPEIATQTGKVLIDINNGKPDFDAMIPSLLENTMPLIMIGLVVVLVLSASMSTLSALVLTSSSTLTIDLIKPSYKKEMTDKKEMFIMRLLIAVFLIISVIIALNKNSYISTLMSISLGALAGSFLGPLHMAYSQRKSQRLQFGLALLQV